MREAQFCPSCAALVDSRLMFYKIGIPIYKCGGCGLGWAMADGFNPESYYDASYFNGGKSDGYSDYASAEEVLREQFSKELALICKLGKRQGHLLELGCAHGFFLEEAKRYFKVSGVEISKDAVAICHSKGLADVRQGMISDETLMSIPQVDVIVMLDVIEHLPTPSSALASAAAKLQPGGLMMITTGDFASLFAKLTGKNWRLMTPPQHLWYFTPFSLKQMGARLGLEIIHLDHPFKKVPIGLMIYQICRYLSFTPELPKWTHRYGIPVNLFDAMRVVFRKSTQ